MFAVVLTDFIMMHTVSSNFEKITKNKVCLIFTYLTLSDNSRITNDESKAKLSIQNVSLDCKNTSSF